MKKLIMTSVAVVVVLSVAVWLHFYRQKAPRIGVLFSGYQLESVSGIGDDHAQTNPQVLQSISKGSLQARHTYVFRKMTNSNDVSFARYRLPVRLWLASCRVVKPAGRLAVVFVGPPVFRVQYECRDQRGLVSNRLVEMPDRVRTEEQLVVTSKP